MDSNYKSRLIGALSIVAGMVLVCGICYAIRPVYVFAAISVILVVFFFLGRIFHKKGRVVITIDKFDKITVAISSILLAIGAYIECLDGLKQVANIIAIIAIILLIVSMIRTVIANKENPIMAVIGMMTKCSIVYALALVIGFGIAIFIIYIFLKKDSNGKIIDDINEIMSELLLDNKIKH